MERGNRLRTTRKGGVKTSPQPQIMEMQLLDEDWRLIGNSVGCTNHREFVERKDLRSSLESNVAGITKQRHTDNHSKRT